MKLTKNYKNGTPLQWLLISIWMMIDLSPIAIDLAMPQMHFLKNNNWLLILMSLMLLLIASVAGSLITEWGAFENIGGNEQNLY